MRYWWRKTLKYGGMITLALLTYGTLMLLWSLVEPWKNYEWNNRAVHTNGTIMQHEIREFPSENGSGTLYAGYILVKYGDYWTQLCAVEDTTSKTLVEQILSQNYTINTNVTIYYQASAPSYAHLGPKSILDFLIWCIINVVIFIVLITIAVVLIYRDHKNSFHPAEHIPLYTHDDIKTNTQALQAPQALQAYTTKIPVQLGKLSDESDDLQQYSYDDIEVVDYLPQSYTDEDVKLTDYIPASYNL